VCERERRRVCVRERERYLAGVVTSTEEREREHKEEIVKVEREGEREGKRESD